jgi:hypothetical protein
MVLLNFGLGISGKIKETPDKQSTAPNKILVVWLKWPIPDDFDDEIIRLAEWWSALQENVQFPTA